MPPPFTNTPRLAQRDIPATMATGTAKISGHGVATTSTANARNGSPVANHAPAATASDSGMNSSAYWSASLAAGALARWAASTSRTMPAKVLSAAGVVAITSNGVAALTASLRTTSPDALRTGNGSPVRADSSSTAAAPDTVPSVGTASPGRTSSRSPGVILSSGTWTSSPPS